MAHASGHASAHTADLLSPENIQLPAFALGFRNIALGIAVVGLGAGAAIGYTESFGTTSALARSIKITSALNACPGVSGAAANISGVTSESKSIYLTGDSRLLIVALAPTRTTRLANCAPLGI